MTSPIFRWNKQVRDRRSVGNKKKLHKTNLHNLVNWMLLQGLERWLCDRVMSFSHISVIIKSYLIDWMAEMHCSDGYLNDKCLWNCSQIHNWTVQTFVAEQLSNKERVFTWNKRVGMTRQPCWDHNLCAPEASVDFAISTSVLNPIFFYC